MTSVYSYWLSSANLALGIFNLIPAFPLDGGRAFRSILAARQGQMAATAQSELFVLTSRGILGDLKVNQAFTPSRAAADHWTVDETIGEMMRARVALLPVMMEDGGSGVIALDSIAHLRRPDWPTTRIQGFVEPARRVLGIHDLLSAALPEIASTITQALPVVEDGKLVGVLRYAALADAIRFRTVEKAA